MITDIDKYVDFLCRHQINEHQFLILWLIFNKDTESIKKYKQAKGEFSTIDIEYLIDRGWITDFNVASAYNIFNMLVTDKFTKAVVIDEDDAYEELCKVYPPWMTIKGVKVPMISGDPSKLSKEYHKAHKGNRLAHQRILSITERYFKNKPPMTKIENYILNRHWNLLESELDKGVGQDVFKTL
jgi:hypothetical protein